MQLRRFKSKTSACLVILLRSFMTNNWQQKTIYSIIYPFKLLLAFIYSYFLSLSVFHSVEKYFIIVFAVNNVNINCSIQHNDSHNST